MNIINSLLISAIILVLHFTNRIHAAPTRRDVCTSKGQLRVHLTVSPLVTDALRQLEIHWTGATPVSGDWIGIFESNPEGASSLPPSLAVVDPATSVTGWERTQITEQHRPNSSVELGFTPRCIGYYVGYVRDDAVLASNCLRLEPTWITERPELGRFSLVDIFIPSTHNSGAWGEYDDDIGETPVTKYTVCQDEDVLSQLIHGIRHLDIRVGYYPFENASRFWLNHGYFKMHRMEDVASQVRIFLNNTPQTEIVIFDIHEFTPGFNSMEDHDKFVQFLKQEFEAYIIPRDTTFGWTTTLNTLWATQKRLIISYDDSSVIAKHTWLWQGIQHKWGDVRFLNRLYVYLQRVMMNPPANSRVWSAMAELTPTSIDVITDVLGGLRVMSDKVNRNVTSWFQGDWGKKANAVAVDFFRGSDIIKTALDWNDKRVALHTGKCII